MKSIPSALKSPALFAASFFLAASTMYAQAPAAPDVSPAPPVAAVPVAEVTFGYELGRAMVDHDAAGRSVYTVAATQDIRSKQTGAKIRLMVYDKDAAGTNTHLLTLNTGKYKTVDQMTGILADIFRKYLAVTPANQEIGKIGDISRGGEIRFFAASPESLRYDWMVPGEPAHSTSFKRNDIQVFLGILTHPKAGN